MKSDYNISEVVEVVKPSVAYTLGLIWADGCVYFRPNKKSQMVKITMVSEDLAKLKPILDSAFRFSYKSYQPHNKNCREQTSAITYKRGLCNFLKENDYTSKINSADKILSHIQEKLKPHWFRGLIDGDGCFYIHKNKKAAHMGIYSEYNQDWSFVENQLKKLEIKYSIYRRKRKKGAQSEIRILNAKDVVRFGKWLYSDKNFIGLDRKYQKYLQIKNDILPNIRKRNTQFKGVYFWKSRNWWYIKPVIEGKIKHIGGFESDIKAYEYLKQFSDFSGKKANWSGII
jgi:hypothetical protein